MTQAASAHRIAITPHRARVIVRFNGAIVADTTKALDLVEGAMKPVLYVPREDAVMAILSPTERSTHCPFKGDASYFTIASGGETADNAVWSYVEPYPAMAEIAGHLAFYPDKVTFETV